MKARSLNWMRSCWKFWDGDLSFPSVKHGFSTLSCSVLTWHMPQDFPILQLRILFGSVSWNMRYMPHSTWFTARILHPKGCNGLWVPSVKHCVTIRVTCFPDFFSALSLAIALSSQILKNSILSVGLTWRAALGTTWAWWSFSRMALVDGELCRYKFLAPLISEIQLSLTVRVPACPSQINHCTSVSHFCYGLSALLNDRMPRSTHTLLAILLCHMQCHSRSILFRGRASCERWWWMGTCMEVDLRFDSVNKFDP